MAQNNCRSPLSDAERDARRKAERELLADAVEQLKTTEGWLRWLRVRKAFHAYSMGNQLLIALQKPDATRVAGFQAWLRLGRCVCKGEKAIKIFAPVPPSRKKLEEWKAAGSDPKLRPRTLFRLASVFDISQVAPLPEPAVVTDLDPPFDLDLAGEDLIWVLESGGPLEQLASELGVALTQVERAGPREAHGWYRHGDRTICVYLDAAANTRAATAVHEFAHALVRLDRCDGDPELDYAREELVVESVAYSVLSVLGVDTGAASIPYLAVWSEGVPISTIEAHAKLIDRLARRLEDALFATRRGDEGSSSDGGAR